MARKKIFLPFSKEEAKFESRSLPSSLFSFRKSGNDIREIKNKYHRNQRWCQLKLPVG
jgi:hypothetical protein